LWLKKWKFLYYLIILKSYVAAKAQYPEITMPEITVIEIAADSPVKRGQIYGEHARRQIKNVIEMYRDVVGTIGDYDWDVIKEQLGPYLDCAKAFAPELVEEIKGIAQGQR
jgi:isopenicillin-N N-acyltransferase-like protein